VRNLPSARFALLLCALAEGPVPPPVPVPVPVVGEAGSEGPEERAPISMERLRVVLLRAERNLILHGLCLHGRYLDRALADYREALACMPAEAGADARFTAAFGLLFALARTEPPSDAAARAAIDREWRAAMAVAEPVNPDFPGLAVVAGTMASAVGDPLRAVEFLDSGLARLEKVTGLAPWQVDQLAYFGRLARGVALLDSRLSREDRALEDFEAAVALARRFQDDPFAPRGGRCLVLALSHRSSAEQRLAYFQRAEATLDSLLTLDPGVALHAFNRGLVAASQQKFDEAIRFYREAIRLDPRDPRPRLKVAYILLLYPPGGGAPRIKEAIPEASAYRSLVGTRNEEYAAFEGEVALLEGRLKDAEAHFREALARSPGCRHALNRLVQIVGQESRRSSAREAELEEWKARMAEQQRRRSAGGEGMETAAPDLTFC
jgi:tetratricopeptide (TPR) repeat protein